MLFNSKAVHVLESTQSKSFCKKYLGKKKHVIYEMEEDNKT